MRDTPSAELTSQGCRRFKPYPTYKDSGVDWLGDIPAHWSLQRLKYNSYLKGRIGWQNLRSEEFTLEGPYLVTGMHFKNGSVDWDACFHVTMERYHMSPEIHVREGDIIVTKDGTIGKTAHIARLPYLATLNSHLLLVRALGGQYRPRFLYYLFDSATFQTYARFAEGGTTFFGITQEAVSNFSITLPSLEEQSAIAAFLDRETAKIDALIAKKEQLIELLQEKRRALITRAVTRGLDPNVPMKDSGIEWMGEIPAHWEVKPFTKYVVEKSDYRGKTPEKVASGVFLVTARNVKMGLIDYECSQEFIAEEDYDEIMRRGLPRRGDILFTTEAPLGNVALVDREDIALAQRIIRFRMNAKHFDSRFTLFAMMSGYFQAQLVSLSTGSTAEGLKATKLPMLRLVAPSPAEQRAIVEFIDQETAIIDALLAKVRDAIERLKEYRTALISATVTGKIDIREAA